MAMRFQEDSGGRRPPSPARGRSPRIDAASAIGACMFCLSGGLCDQRREGVPIYREEKLAVPRRGGRKRTIGTRAPITVPKAPNDRWSLDFVSDQLTDGRRFRLECLALVANTSLSGTRVAAGTGPAGDRARQAEDGGQ
jgi:hypothetical protein